jgi:hypothetical protein
MTELIISHSRAILIPSRTTDWFGHSHFIEHQNNPSFQYHSKVVPRTTDWFGDPLLLDRFSRSVEISYPEFSGSISRSVDSINQSIAFVLISLRYPWIFSYLIIWMDSITSLKSINTFKGISWQTHYLDKHISPNDYIVIQSPKSQTMV